MASLYAHSQFGSPFEAPIDHKNDIKLPLDIKVAFLGVWCLYNPTFKVKYFKNMIS